MRSSASTPWAMPPPPGMNATGMARMRMIATFRTVRSTPPILLSRHHDDAYGHGRERGQQGDEPQRAESDGGRRASVAVPVREPGRAEDREREDQRDPDAGDEGRDHRLQQRLGVDDRRQHDS